MTLVKARKILGLGPDEDPRPHLAEFRAARERIAEMVRTAPNETLGDRYQEGLVEFDKALAAVREYLEALGLAIPQDATPQADESQTGETAAEEDEAPAPRRRMFAGFVWFLVFLVGAAGGGFIYFKNEEDKETRRQLRLTLLERLGSEFIENRRWQEAASAFAEMETLVPGSEIARRARRSIEAGMTEEQNQFVGYWTGQAIAELDAGRLVEAEAAIRKVIEKTPHEKEPAAILVRITNARTSQSRDVAIASARKLLDEQKFDQAISAAHLILSISPHDTEAKSIIEDASATIEKQAIDQQKALSLLQQAITRDKGEFDQEILDLLREAATLAPGNQDIAARLETMASYTRTLRIPGDFATPAEALAVARDRDRIVLAENTWKGPLFVNAAVELIGAGPGKTIVECPAADGCAITIGPDAKGARITGIAFRHESFLVVGTDRFSAALVRSGGATFTDCHFSDASGHGLAVIENGETIASRCRFTGNGWNGAAAIGKGTLLEVRDSESIDNFEHGIESWDQAAVTLINNRCQGNSRNGIHTANGSAAATIEGNQLIANREFGIVLDSAGSGKLTGNTVRGNLMGGIVIRTTAEKLSVTGNQSTLNQGPGLVLETGLSPSSYSKNTISKNKQPEVLTGAILSNPDEKSR